MKELLDGYDKNFSFKELYWKEIKSFKCLGIIISILVGSTIASYVLFRMIDCISTDAILNMFCSVYIGIISFIGCINRLIELIKNSMEHKTALKFIAKRKRST